MGKIGISWATILECCNLTLKIVGKHSYIVRGRSTQGVSVGEMDARMTSARDRGNGNTSYRVNERQIGSG
jgi:hypothetical protein